MKSKFKLLSLLFLVACLSFTIVLAGCSEPEGKVESTLSVSKVYLEIEKGNNAHIFAGYDGKTEISFTSTDESVATVSAEGGHAVITANKEGVAYISISVSGQSKTCKVVVFTSQYDLILDREESELLAWVGVTHQITARILKNSDEIDGELKWNVSGGDYNIVLDGNRALITFNEIGEYIITVAYENFVTESYTISVVNQAK